MKIDRRMVAMLTAQLLKETENMAPTGDFMTCLRYERTFRSIPGKEKEILPAMYRYHKQRINELTHLSIDILSEVDSVSDSREGFGTV